MRAIAMKCTQKQFESIKPKLEDAGIDIFMIGSFSLYHYLFLFEDMTITNGTLHSGEGREIYETWDEKVFLEACGIEVEETYQITKETILKYQMKDEFPECFEKVNGYYKHKNNEHEKWFCHMDFATGEYYGHNNSEWMSGNYNDMIFYIEKNCITMTPQEVQQALEKEAVKRYKKGDCVKGLYTGKASVLTFENTMLGKRKIYIDEYFSIWINIGNSRNEKVFENGIWATIIHQYTQQEAEEKFNFKTVVR